MTKRSVTHGTFTIDRTFDAPPKLVFDAFASPEAKQRWFHGPEDWTPEQHALDFRVGGRETSSGGPKEGPIHRYDARYQDIIPNERIIYTYDMHLDDVRISVSLATVTFESKGKGTRLLFTEQGVFLDGFDDAGGREQGTREILEQLARSLPRS